MMVLGVVGPAAEPTGRLVRHPARELVGISSSVVGEDYPPEDRSIMRCWKISASMTSEVSGNSTCTSVPKS